MRCAFIEILNEEVRDLLHPDTPSKAISIRERADGAICVSGIREVPVAAAADLQRLLDSGSVSRATGATRMNDASSRSHAIFTIMIEQTARGALSAAGQQYTSAKFHLVDLAGRRVFQARVCAWRQRLPACLVRAAALSALRSPPAQRRPSRARGRVPRPAPPPSPAHAAAASATKRRARLATAFGRQ